MHTTLSSLTLVTVFLSFLNSALGWPALLHGFNKLNRRQSDSSSPASYYTTIYNTETVTESFTDIKTATLPATETTTYDVPGGPSLSGGSRAPGSPQDVSSTTTIPEPTTTTIPLSTGSPSSSSASDSVVPFPQMNSSTYSLIATAPPQSTGIVCVENDYLQALQNFSLDATPFCSTYLSIPLYTVTADSATVYVYVPFSNSLEH